MDFEPNDDDFRLACKLHGEALETANAIRFLEKYEQDPAAAARISRWLPPEIEHYAKTEGPASVAFTLKSRGWDRVTVLSYASAPERGLPRKWPPKERAAGSRRPGGDWGAAPDPLQAIRSVLDRLKRFVPEAPLPSPERQQELTGWLRSNAEAIGKPTAYARVVAEAEPEDPWERGFSS